MLSYILIVIIAYLLGNISTSYIIAKKMMGVDIRTQGSGNAGSTNVLRTLGKKAGAMTFIGDLLKGVIAVLIAKLIATISGVDIATSGYLAVVGVVCGHNWPAFLGFRGGKGVATSLGFTLYISINTSRLHLICTQPCTLKKRTGFIAVNMEIILWIPAMFQSNIHRR